MLNFFDKIYALKGWALNNAEKPKGLKPGWGNFQKLSWYQSFAKIQNFKHSEIGVWRKEVLNNLLASTGCSHGFQS